MLVSFGSTRQPEKEMHQDKAGVNEVDHKPLGFTECVSNIPVSVRPSQTSLHVVDISYADPEQLDPEHSLGCARGVLWALIFEGGLAIAALVYWKLHLLAR